MQFGTTFSSPYLRDYFKLSVSEAFLELLKLEFAYLRLGCYWADSEKTPRMLDFAELERLLELASKAGQKIILTLGMKAPRWPEFWVPHWTRAESVIASPEPALKFIDSAVNRLGKYPAVSYWQVENEPLDQSGPQKLVLPISLLEQEVALVRSANSKPILLTLWGNRTLRDSRLQKLTSLADVVGIDLYYQIPNGQGGFWGPSDSLDSLKKIVQNQPKPIWITELQTNPWKKSLRFNHLEIIRENWERALALKVPLTLLWGFEYWFALLKKGDSTIYEFVRNKLALSR